jgi:crotonobetainyl-CoA:carnitine CoA-transferase CaiB-like acyl-CoA transferase
VPLDHPKFGHVADVMGMGVPITFSGAAAIPLRPAPCVGQDNDLVYGNWLGYSQPVIEKLRVDGVI